MDGIAVGIGAEMAGLGVGITGGAGAVGFTGGAGAVGFTGGAGALFAVFVVRLLLVGCWLFACVLPFAGFLGSKGILCLGGGRRPGDMAACCLVNLVGVHGAFLLAAVVPTFSFFWTRRVPGTISSTCIDKHASY